MKKTILFLSLLSTSVFGADKIYTEGTNQFITTSCIPPSTRTDDTPLTQAEIDGGSTTLYFSTSTDFNNPIKIDNNLDKNCTSSIPITEFNSGIYYKAATFTDSEGRTSDYSTSASLEVIRTPDLEPPSAPTNLTLNTLSYNEIELNWEASTDNIGVTVYNIYRDSVYVAQALGTAYIDSGLSSETSYSYEVTAMDSSSNESAKSTQQVATTDVAPEPGIRVVDKLYAFYDFTKGSLEDTIGSNNLILEGDTAWVPDGLHFTAGRAFADGTNLVNTLKAANAFTVETWIKSDNVTQTGPARIIAISQDSGLQNFMIGQRTTGLESRLEPSVRIEAINMMDTTRKHIVYTFDGTTGKLYVDNVLLGNHTGNISGWRNTDLLNIGNENINDRFYNGVISLVAIYSKALSVSEIDTNFNAGIITTPPVLQPPNPPIINN